VRPPREEDARATTFARAPETNGANGASSRTVAHDARSGRTTLVLDRIRGRRHAREDDLEVEGSQRDVFTIVEGDPLSAAVECERSMQMHREGWSARVETHSTMTADLEVFRLVTLVEAYENGERIYSRERSFEVPRDLV